MLYRISYFIRTALRSIRRNLILNLVSAATISLALLIMSAFLLLNVNLQKLAASSTEDLYVSVYLKDKLDSKILAGLKKKVATFSGVKSVKYISKDQALADLKKRLGGQANILEGLDQNPLPASLELEIDQEIKKKGRVSGLTNKIGSLKGVDEVYYAWEWADRLKAFIRFIRLSGFLAGGLLFLAIVFIIANTIKLTVMAREDELYIMRLMGATETFVRTPFVIEGVLQGLAGGLAALAGLYVVFYILISQINLPFGMSLVKLSFLPPFLVWFLMASGGVLGFLGSMLSVGRLSKS